MAQEILDGEIVTAIALTGTERLIGYRDDAVGLPIINLVLGRVLASASRIAEPFDADDLQKMLDDYNELVLPAGTYTPTNRVLFCDQPNQKIRGHSKEKTILNSRVFVGWRRGLIPDARFVAGGYNTGGNTHLTARGTAFDQGPELGWETLTSFSVNVVGSLPSGTWTGKAVTGIRQAVGPYAPNPSPWTLWCDGTGTLQFNILANNGTTYTFTAPHPSGTTLDWLVNVDFTTGIVSATVAGASVVVTGTMPSGLRFAANNRWAWSLGNFSGYGNEIGYFGSDPLYDATFTTYALTGSGSFTASLTWTRTATYSGGASLPLVSASSSVGTTSVMAVLNSQGVDTSSGATINDVTISGINGNPTVLIGSILQGLTIENCLISLGSYGLLSSQITVNYPITIIHTVFQYQTDCSAYIFTCARLKIDGCEFLYPAKRFLHLESCVGTVSNCFGAPPEGHREMLLQYGGQVNYTTFTGDYEGATYPPVIRLIPSSQQTATWGTCARLIDTIAGVNPLVARPVIEARETGYTGPVSIVIDDGGGFVGDVINNAGTSGVSILYLPGPELTIERLNALGLTLPTSAPVGGGFWLNAGVMTLAP